MTGKHWAGLLLAVVFCGDYAANAQSSLDSEIESLGLELSAPALPQDADGSVLQDPQGLAESSNIGSEVRVLLRPASTTTLSSKAKGQIRSLPFNIGDAFAEGDALVKIGCNDTYAEIQIAKARLNVSRVENESNRNLLAQGGVSKFDVDLSAAKVEEAEAVLKKYQAAAGDCAVYAPYAGKVVALHANQYEYVNSGQPVLEVIDDSVLEMQLYVPSGWITRLSLDTRFRVSIEEVGKEYDARIMRMNPRVDAGSKTLEIIAAMEENHSELRPGMSGNARFPQ